MFARIKSARRMVGTIVYSSIDDMFTREGLTLFCGGPFKMVCRLLFVAITPTNQEDRQASGLSYGLSSRGEGVHAVDFDHGVGSDQLPERARDAGAEVALDPIAGAQNLSDGDGEG